MKTFLDWSAYDTYGMGDAYAGIPATGGNYAKAVAVCMNNHQCQRDGKGVMCPSFQGGAEWRVWRAAVHPSRSGGGDGSMRLVQGLQEGVPELGRHDTDQNRIPGASQ